MHSLLRLACLLLPLLAGLSPGLAQEPAERRRPPNIILILADDAAFMDFGAFGGEAKTPVIDGLSAAGAMLTNYHTSPLCSPSRAMLLTGMDAHLTGVSTIEEVLPPELKDKPGYTLSLEPGVLTLADRLKAAGYRTLMTGKWHLGHDEGELPNHHGFDRSLALDASGADNWTAKSYMPYYNHAPWFEDGRPAKLPERFYSSEFLVDRLIDYIDEADTGQPFFGYLAFQAVHIPVQAPRAFSDRYRGQFDAGWETVRSMRWRRAIEAGIIPPDAPFAGLPPGSRAWSSLSEEDRARYARAMEVYSGMIEAMDFHIGRLVDHIEARGELANTIFVITSDNGPEPSDPVHEPWMDVWMAFNGYQWSLQTMGDAGSLGFIGPEWAAAISAPGSFYKFYASEGGIRVPLVIKGPGVRTGVRTAALSFVSDVTPTLLELAGVPLISVAGDRPVTGRSLVPLLAGTADRVYGPEDAIGLEVSGNAALLRDRWKLVRNMPPVGDGRWRLYDLQRDPAETNDLSAVSPALFDSLLADYTAYERRSGVLALPPGYEAERQVRRNALGRQLSFMAAPLAAAAAGLLALCAFIYLMIKSRRRQTSL